MATETGGWGEPGMTWFTCWCMWSEDDDDLSHDAFVAENDYPPHEPSVEWNVPEPDEPVG